MFITEKLKQLADEFLTELQTAEQNARTEAQFDELETICEDLICGLPITIIQKDFYKRSDIRTYIDDKEKDNTKRVSRYMKGLYNLDTIAFCYDMVNQAIQDDIESIAENDKKNQEA